MATARNETSKTRGGRRRNMIMVMALANRRSMDAELVIIEKRRSYGSREEADGGDVLMLKVVDSEGSSSNYRFDE